MRKKNGNEAIKMPIIYEKTPRLSSENLAINEICLDMVKNSKYGFLARFYHHLPCAILAANQSINDLNPNECQKKGYEISKRKTGGSAIIATPELALCYSFFFKRNPLSGTNEEIYEKLTNGLMDNLSEKFSIKGNYYLRFNDSPIAGHAMHGFNAIQFDGIIHLQSPNIDEFSKLMKLRKSHECKGKKFMEMDGNIYEIKKSRAYLSSQNAKDLILLRNESEELRQMKGLNEAKMDLEDFLSAWAKTIEKIFKKQEIMQKYEFDESEINKRKKKFINKEYLKKGGICMGHCFCDFLEPEELN